MRFLIAFLLLTTPLFAQNKDPEAKKILEAVSKKYKENSTFKADFILEMLTNEESEPTESIEGKVWFKDDMYHLDLGDQEIFNNKATTWTYLKSDNEVTVMEYEASEEEINLSNITELYESNFKYMLLASTKKDGRMVNIVDLTPEDKDLTYFKVRLEVDEQTSELVSWKIFEYSGRQYQYSLKNYDASVSLTAKDFEFDASKYPDVYVVDLR